MFHHWDQLQDKGATLEELSKNPEVLATIKAEVKSLISNESGFKSFEKVVDIQVLPKAFEVGDELTNLFKLKRHIITEKYQALVDSMYK